MEAERRPDRRRAGHADHGREARVVAGRHAIAAARAATHGARQAGRARRTRGHARDRAAGRRMDDRLRVHEAQPGRPLRADGPGALPAGLGRMNLAAELMAADVHLEDVKNRLEALLTALFPSWQRWS